MFYIIGLLKNTLENTCCGVSFLIKLEGWDLQLYRKKRFRHMYFPINFATFLKTPFFTEHHRATPSENSLQFYLHQTFQLIMSHINLSLNFFQLFDRNQLFFDTVKKLILLIFYYYNKVEALNYIYTSYIHCVKSVQIRIGVLKKGYSPTFCAKVKIFVDNYIINLPCLRLYMAITSH